jgi:DNA mismatch repair protein MSH2
MHFGAETSQAPSGSTTLRFTYRLQPGPCERSYGIFVAQLAKLPPQVIEEAQRKADELESFSAAPAASSSGGYDLFLAKMEPAVQEKLSSYAEQIRELTKQQRLHGNCDEELKALRAAITADPDLQVYLKE